MAHSDRICLYRLPEKAALHHRFLNLPDADTVIARFARNGADLVDGRTFSLALRRPPSWIILFGRWRQVFDCQRSVSGLLAGMIYFLTHIAMEQPNAKSGSYQDPRIVQKALFLYRRLAGLLVDIRGMMAIRNIIDEVNDAIDKEMSKTSSAKRHHTK